MKKLLFTALSILIITVCCSCDDSADVSQVDNSSQSYKSPAEIIAELTEIEPGTELSQLQEMGLIDLDVLGINADEYSYKGRFDAHVGGDYFLTDNSGKPEKIRYQYISSSKESILIDKYGRLLSADVDIDTYLNPTRLSEDELVGVATNVAKAYFKDEFSKYKLSDIFYSQDNNSASIYWRKEGKERFADLIVVELTTNGWIREIGMGYSDLPDNYSYNEIDTIAEKWFEDNLKKIYPETKSHVVDKNSVRNIDGKVYGWYVATITTVGDGYSCVELVVQDMSAGDEKYLPDDIKP